MLSSSLDGVSASTHFAQHLFMSFQFPIRRDIDGDSLFQQIENHLADSIDLIGVGVCQHVLTLVSIGFFQDALQKGALSSQPLHRRFLCPVGWAVSYMMSHDTTRERFPGEGFSFTTVEFPCSFFVGLEGLFLSPLLQCFGDAPGFFG